MSSVYHSKDGGYFRGPEFLAYGKIWIFKRPIRG